MEAFLKSIERQAYRIALVGTRLDADALDLVQDSMLRFVTKYARKPQQQWKPLFYQILHNSIRDYHRRRKAGNRWLSWLTSVEDSEEDPLENLSDPRQRGAEHEVQLSGAFAQLEQELKDLPFRQQQAFLLRAWEELSVAETAAVMNCSEGSVKTHYFRALERLRERLGDHWP